MNFHIIHPLGHIVASTDTIEEVYDLLDSIYTDCDYSYIWVNNESDDLSRFPH